MKHAVNTFHSCIYQGHVTHQRLHPVQHQFNYAVSSWLIDLDELTQLQQLRGFSVDNLNVFAFYQRDHGDGSLTPLREQIVTLLAGFDLHVGNGRIQLLCYPRILGYVFNPLSVFYCYDEQQQLIAIIYEVSNTFKQRHAYVMPFHAIERSDKQTLPAHGTEKIFYVSPFMPMQTHYQFNLSQPHDQISVHIRQSDPQQTVFNAGFSGHKVNLTQRNLYRTFLRHPLMTLKVIGGIHWEALLLWKKGMKIQPRPEHPTYHVSLISPQGV